MIIDCISDLHGFYPKLKGGDLLIIAGDLTAQDTEDQHQAFLEWVLVQPYRKVFIVPGNHDNLYEKKQIRGWYTFPKPNFISLLIDELEEFEGLKIWGSPWTSRFEGMNPHCMAFTVETDEDLDAKWDLIPSDIDILVTHSPPMTICDGVMKKIDKGQEIVSCGSRGLLRKLMSNAFPKLKLHVFGHIHEGYGEAQIGPDLVLFNASHVTRTYKPKNDPMRIEF